MKLHEIMISTLLLSAIFLSFTSFFADGIEKYSASVYEDPNLQAFEESLTKITEANAEAQEGFGKLASTNVFDILGGVFQASIGLINSFIASGNVIISIFAQGLGFLPLGPIMGNLWISTAAGCILVAFTIGILAHFVNKSERL